MHHNFNRPISLMSADLPQSLLHNSRQTNFIPEFTLLDIKRKTSWNNWSTRREIEYHYSVCMLQHWVFFSPKTRICSHACEHDTKRRFSITLTLGPFVRREIVRDLQSVARLPSKQFILTGSLPILGLCKSISNRSSYISRKQVKMLVLRDTFMS